MTASRDPDRLIGAFLAEGITELPDRTFDVVRQRIHGKRQRAVLGRLTEPSTSMIARLAVAAAVVVAVGAAVMTVAPSLPSIGGPTPSPTASPQPIPNFQPLSGGRYTFTWGEAAGADGEPGPSVTVTIPPVGWTSYATFAADKNYGPSESQAGASFVMWKIVSRFVDGCDDGSGRTRLSPAPGPGIDELLEALADQPGLTAGPLTPVTVDGYAGKFVELTVAIDIATCPSGFFPWVDKYVQGNNEVLRVYAIDVDGFRLTFFARIPERTTEADRAELETIIESIDIEPLTP
jgi:hypothetical protein